MCIYSIDSTISMHAAAQCDWFFFSFATCILCVVFTLMATSLSTVRKFIAPNSMSYAFRCRSMGLAQALSLSSYPSRSLSLSSSLSLPPSIFSLHKNAEHQSTTLLRRPLSWVRIFFEQQAEQKNKNGSHPLRTTIVCIGKPD